jgi:hypothetical protein
VQRLAFCVRDAAEGIAEEPDREAPEQSAPAAVSTDDERRLRDGARLGRRLDLRRRRGSAGQRAHEEDDAEGAEAPRGFVTPATRTQR